MKFSVETLHVLSLFTISGLIPLVLYFIRRRGGFLKTWTGMASLANIIEVVGSPTADFLAKASIVAGILVLVLLLSGAVEKDLD